MPPFAVFICCLSVLVFYPHKHLKLLLWLWEVINHSTKMWSLWTCVFAALTVYFLFVCHATCYTHTRLDSSSALSNTGKCAENSIIVPPAPHTHSLLCVSLLQIMSSCTSPVIGLKSHPLLTFCFLKPLHPPACLSTGNNCPYTVRILCTCEQAIHSHTYTQYCTYHTMSKIYKHSQSYSLPPRHYHPGSLISRWVLDYSRSRSEQQQLWEENKICLLYLSWRVAHSVWTLMNISSVHVLLYSVSCMPNIIAVCYTWVGGTVVPKFILFILF